MSDDPSGPARGRPLAGLPLAPGQPAPAPARHETRLPADDPEAVSDLEAAMAAPDRRAAVAAVVAARPGLLEAWARLGETVLAGGDAVLAYACARVAYHRGLDRLRRHGWGGTGIVRWSHAPNRGFLRGLRLLLVTAAALGELDESTRCRQFLLDLDPDDGLGAAAYPDEPGPEWAAPPPPP